MKIAILDTRGRDADIAHNVEVLRQSAVSASETGANLLLVGECFLTGYNLTRDETEELALADGSPVWDEVAEVARTSGLHLAVSAVTAREAARFNSLRLYDPDGDHHQYDKVHLPPLGADRWVSPGARFTPPVTTEHGSVGLSICYDIRFPESHRSLALAGAGLVLVPACYPAGAERVPGTFPTVRAMENGIWVAMAAGGGSERGISYVTGSQVVDPTGAQRGARLEGTDLIFADIGDLGDGQRAQYEHYHLDPLGDRRPEAYSTLGASR